MPNSPLLNAFLTGWAHLLVLIFFLLSLWHLVKHFAMLLYPTSMTKTKLGHEVEAASRGAAAVVVTSKRRPWVLVEAGAGREEQMKARAPRTMGMAGNRQLREAEGSGEVGRIWSLRHPAAMLEQGTGGTRRPS